MSAIAQHERNLHLCRASTYSRNPYGEDTSHKLLYLYVTVKRFPRWSGFGEDR